MNKKAFKPIIDKLNTYEVEVTFKVKACTDADAELALVYALEHSPLVTRENGISGFEFLEGCVTEVNA